MASAESDEEALDLPRPRRADHDGPPPDHRGPGRNESTDDLSARRQRARCEPEHGRRAARRRHRRRPRAPRDRERRRRALLRGATRRLPQQLVAARHLPLSPRERFLPVALYTATAIALTWPLAAHLAT